MDTVTQSIIEGKMTRLNAELKTSLRMPGQTFESVTLGLGDTTLSREVLPDGSRGEIHINTRENDDLIGFSATYQKYMLVGGDLIPDARYGERNVGMLKKASVLAKIALGRVSHWDNESEFYGTNIDLDGE